MQKHTPVNISNSYAFTLIEMLGVLSVISILAAMLAPKIIKSIRESKITSAIASVDAAHIAAIHYYQRYERIPTDSEISTVLNYKLQPKGNPPVAYAPEVGALNLGHLLIYQTQILEQEKVTVGRPTSELNFAIGSSLVGDELVGGATYSNRIDKMLFQSAANAVQIVYYFMPNLTLQEAAGLAVKVNGPFGINSRTELDFVKASLIESGIADTSGLEGANVWFTGGDQEGEYHAYVYIFHI